MKVSFFRAMAIAAVIAFAALQLGAYTGKQELVEEVYTVRQGDTLWDIGVNYLPKNTGGRRYILEFISGIRELNPWLLERHDQLRPGDKLRINYWVDSSQR